MLQTDQSFNQKVYSKIDELRIGLLLEGQPLLWVVLITTP